MPKNVGWVKRSETQHAVPRRALPRRWVLQRVLNPTYALLALCLSCAAQAASIGVTPTLIDLSAGESVAGLQVNNDDAVQPVSVQARLVRWHQEAGEDVYTPTDAVVASPPVARVAPGAENLIRIVRTDKTLVVGEESYRLLIDQLPEPGAQAAGTVTILIRHAVPVFFAGAGAAPAQAQWKIARASQTDENGVTRRGWQVTVSNSGDKRLRLANLILRDESGRVVGQRPGLVGYVLGRSNMAFFVQADAAGTTSGSLRVSVQSETQTVETALLPVAAP